MMLFANRARTRCPSPVLGVVTCTLQGWGALEPCAWGTGAGRRSPCVTSVLSPLSPCE